MMARSRFYRQLCRIAISILALAILHWYLFLPLSNLFDNREHVRRSFSSLTNIRLSDANRERNFTESRREWIANGASAAREMIFTSTEFPMKPHRSPIVPNIVHFIKFRSTEISFTELVTMVAVHVNHRPEAIFIHCSLCSNGITMGGKYWDILLTYQPPVHVLFFPEPVEIFNQKLTSPFHASDIGRMLVLMEHGGIYLDNDVFVINPLDAFLHYEMTLGWDQGSSMGTQVLVAHRNARFLRQWYDSYHDYQGERWYYNAGELPTTSVLVKKGYLANRVKHLFGVKDYTRQLYDRNDWEGWRDFFTLHLLARHRRDRSVIVNFDDVNIKTYDRTFGRMARLALYNTTDYV